jgi:hypothetical protein
MAQHGYLREYDETPDRDADRDRWRDEDRERGREFMFSERDRPRAAASDRFGDEDRQYRSTLEDRWDMQDRPPRNFRSHQDEHYRSWRQKQMEALDREYEDYCREREQQFHRDFDSWRRDRRNQGSNEAAAVESELDLTHENALAGQGNTPSPVGQATLGTNNSENTRPGPGMPSA